MMKRSMILLFWMVGAMVSVSLANKAEQSGAVPPTKVEVEHPGPLTRYELLVKGMLREQRDLFLAIHVQDGGVRQAWARLEGVEGMVRTVDASKVIVTTDRLKGPVEVQYTYEGNTQPRYAKVQIDVARKDATLSGRALGDVADRGIIQIPDKLLFDQEEMSYGRGGVVEGKISGSVIPQVNDKGRVKGKLLFGCILRDMGPPLRLGGFGLDLVFQDGKAVEVIPSAWKWKATIVKQDLRLDAKHLYGTFTLDVTGLKDGRYDVSVDCPIHCNYAGTFSGDTMKSFFEGKQVNPENWAHGLMEPVDNPTGSLDEGVLVFNLEKAYGGEKSIEVKLPVKGGALGTPQVQRDGTAECVDLRLEGNRLRGRLNMTIPHTTGLLAAFAQDAHPWYELDLTIENGKITGSYKGEWGDYRKLDCAVEGRVLDEAAIRAVDAVDPSADWPSWWGPNQHGSALPRGHKLVDDLRKSRLAWVSEQTPPGRGQNFRYREGNLGGLLENGMEAGGCAGPIVYQGRVYQNYVRPSGEPYDKAVLDEYAKEKNAKSGRVGVRTVPMMWSLECDLVVVCIDAATGQTLWKTVFPRVGPYDLFAKRGAFTAFMAAGEGKVFGLTPKDDTFCLDAATGKLEWIVSDGSGELSQVIAGVYVSVDKSGLFGLDPANGKRLWTVPKIGHEVGAPLHWKHDGKDYVIVGDEINGTGKLACVNPTDGSVVWKVDGYGMTTFPALMGDYLVINGAKDKRAVSFMQVSRLTLKGPEEAWKLDPEEYPFSDTRNCITGDGKTLIAVFPGLDKQGSTDQIMAFDVATGKVLSKAPAGNYKFGHSWMMEDRIVVQTDTSHGMTPLTYFSFADGKLSGLGGVDEAWQTRYSTTSGYTPVVFNHCLVDGRLIIRGGRGIVCYDLRAASKP